MGPSRRRAFVARPSQRSHLSDRIARDVRLGLALKGRIFPIEPSQPLVALAALANMGIGVPYFVARAMGYGAGVVTAVTYEYGNTFLIVAGLLNTLVVIDAFDISMGRK